MFGYQSFLAIQQWDSLIPFICLPFISVEMFILAQGFGGSQWCGRIHGFVTAEAHRGDPHRRFSRHSTLSLPVAKASYAKASASVTQVFALSYETYDFSRL